MEKQLCLYFSEEGADSFMVVEKDTYAIGDNQQAQADDQLS